MTDYGSPRGSIPRMVAEAASISEQRLRLTMRLLDEAVDAGQVGTLGGGTRLAYDAFRALLQSDKAFQAQVAARWQFATPQERKRLLDEIRRVFPPAGGSDRAGADSGGPVPAGPVPEEAMRGEPGSGLDLGGAAPGQPPSGLQAPAGVGSGAPPALAAPPTPVAPLSQPPPLPLPLASPGPPPPVTALLPGLPGMASQGAGPVDLGTGPLPPIGPITPAQAAPPPTTLPTNPLGPPLNPVR